MSKNDYNIEIIGDGASGLVTSYIATAVKVKTVLFEKYKIGRDSSVQEFSSFSDFT